MGNNSLDKAMIMIFWSNRFPRWAPPPRLPPPRTPGTSPRARPFSSWRVSDTETAKTKGEPATIHNIDVTREGKDDRIIVKGYFEEGIQERVYFSRLRVL